jgi:hypothetical protein
MMSKVNRGEHVVFKEIVRQWTRIQLWIGYIDIREFSGFDRKSVNCEPERGMASENSEKLRSRKLTDAAKDLEDECGRQVRKICPSGLLPNVPPLGFDELFFQTGFGLGKPLVHPVLKAVISKVRRPLLHAELIIIFA